MWTFRLKSGTMSLVVGLKKTLTNLVFKNKFHRQFQLKTLFTLNRLCKPSYMLNDRAIRLSSNESGDSSSQTEDVDVMISSIKSLYDYQSNLFGIKNKVFVLQPRMQYKAKARQTMSADLQLEESISLIETLNEWEVVDTHIVSTKSPNKRTIWGSGNIENLSKKIAQSGANCLFIGIDRLSNIQVENLRRELLGNDPSMRIFDRYTIVLKIFKKNASSNIAKLQTALAEIPYIRHRFNNSDMHKDIEKRLKAELDKQTDTRKLLNKSRRRSDTPIVSIIGYTNVGKTSLIKRLTQDVKLKPENKLFATLDVTYHGMQLPNSNISVILADTIGFISDIPYTLINAFKVTLQDALDADLLVHVIDCTHPDFTAQESVVLDILHELEADHKIPNMITIYNKFDKLENPSQFRAQQIATNENTVAVSCKTGLGVDELIQMVEKKIVEIKNYLQLELKIEQGSEAMRYLYKNCIVKGVRVMDEDQNYVLMCVMFDRKTAVRFKTLYPSCKVIRKL